MCEEIVCCMFISFLFVVFQILELLNCKRPNDTLDSKTLKETLKERKKISEVMSEQEQGAIGESQSLKLLKKIMSLLLVLKKGTP